MEVRSNRQFTMYGLFIIVGLVFIVQLFKLQILEDSYKAAAESNAVHKEIIHPHRGLIYDRNGKLLVYNEPVYDLMVITREVEMEDTLRFCEALNITKETFEERMNRLLRNFTGQVFIPQLSKLEYAQIQDILFDYPGFYVVPRTIRVYPHRSLANTLGYIGEINATQLKKNRESEKYYEQGDLVGQSGIEASYEPYIRGEKGVKYIVKNKYNQEVGAFRDGALDKKAIPGKKLVASIDLELQQLAEQLLTHKIGGIVAIEPSTGEILTLASAPSYDPNLLTGNKLSVNFRSLIVDEYKPLFNRALQSRYPPGSTFKTVQALIGLQAGVITPKYQFPCARNLVKCHWHPNPTNARTSIQHSCNPFYYNAFRRFVYKDGDSFDSLYYNYDVWRERVLQFGFGRKLGVDIANEGAGSIPKAAFFNKAYGEGRWNYSNIYSLSIGQGEMGVTLLQLGNLAATLANRGFYYIPHLIKGIGEQSKPLPEYQKKHYVGASKRYFNIITNGMEAAFKNGTVGPLAQMPYNKDIVICAKTGTVQNPHGEDHSTFIAFAPKDNPKIAISVYVENAGFGGIWAANIASLMIEQYLTDTIQRPALLKQVVDKAFTKREILRREAIRKAAQARADSLKALLVRKEDE
ncbi:MAG: peptidoglycan D,D-transpeptidase FtsI family protein [Thermonemataceae bacterium]